jgi:hypothetical protein
MLPYVHAILPSFPLSAINHNAKLSRKVVESLVQPRVWSEDNGITWSSATSILDAVSNTMFADNTHDVTVLNYYAFAKQTKQANNESVFNGDAGVGNVFVSQSHEHSVFFESLIGKVITAPYDSTHSSSFSMISLSTNSANKLQSLGIMRNTKHQALDLIGYDAPSAKVLNCQIESKQQLNISYIYEELKYSADWGDDGIMSINSAQTTNTDDNGTTVLTGTSALALSYGWSKNNV